MSNLMLKNRKHHQQQFENVNLEKSIKSHIHTKKSNNKKTEEWASQNKQTNQQNGTEQIAQIQWFP